MAGKPGRSGGSRAGAGRKPLPTAVKRIKGTLRQHRVNRKEPKPNGVLGEPPEYMAGNAKEVWGYALANAPGGLLTPLDAAVLERWANCAETPGNPGLTKATEAAQAVNGLLAVPDSRLKPQLAVGSESHKPQGPIVRLLVDQYQVRSYMAVPVIIPVTS